MTKQNPTPPFRAEHVGSLLRPPELKRAFRDVAQGTIGAGEFAEIQDRAIRDAIAMQEIGRAALHHRRRVSTRLLVLRLCAGG